MKILKIRSCDSCPYKYFNDGGTYDNPSYKCGLTHKKLTSVIGKNVIHDNCTLEEV
jgi:hypothetical protein